MFVYWLPSLDFLLSPLLFGEHGGNVGDEDEDGPGGRCPSSLESGRQPAKTLQHRSDLLFLPPQLARPGNKENVNYTTDICFFTVVAVFHKRQISPPPFKICRLHSDLRSEDELLQSNCSTCSAYFNILSRAFSPLYSRHLF